MSYKEKLLKRFEEFDKRPHADYRLIALNLGVDYHKLDNKNKKLEKEINELKDDKNAIFDMIAKLYDDIEESYDIGYDYILEELARIQAVAK